MRVAPNQAAITPPPVQTSPPAPALKSVAQVVPAEVISQVDNLHYKLQTPVGEKLIASKVPLHPGEKLTLEVVGDLKSNTLIADKAANAAPTTQQVAAEQMRSLLPKQTDAARLLALLPLLTKSADAAPELAKLMAALPSADDLQNPAQLKQEIGRSGLFHEAKILQGQPAEAAKDLKSLLMQLASSLKYEASNNPLAALTKLVSSMNTDTAATTKALLTPGNTGQLAEAGAGKASAVLPQTADSLMRQVKISGELLRQALPSIDGKQISQLLTKASDIPALSKPLQTVGQMLNAPERTMNKSDILPVLKTVAQGLAALQGIASNHEQANPAIAAQIAQLPPSILTALQQPFVSHLHQAIKQAIYLMEKTAPETFSLPEKNPAPLPGQSNAAARAQIDSQLQQALDNSNSSLTQQLLGEEVDGILSRLVSHQLLQVQEQQSPLTHWYLELPVKDRDGLDLWHMKFERDRSKSTTAESNDNERWQVSLTFNFPQTGAVVAQLTQQYGQIYVRFHAEQADAHQWLSEHAEELKQRFYERGLTPGTIEAQRGMPSDTSNPLANRPLLKEQA